jgi:hypothetical protein
MGEVIRKIGSAVEYESELSSNMVGVARKHVSLLEQQSHLTKPTLIC